MDHLAIMDKRKRFIEKILSGEKTIESRWYVNRIAPWNKITSGDTVYLKNSGEQVTLKAKVRKVLQVNNLTPNKIVELLNKYGKEIGFEKANYKNWAESSAKKHYCILVFLSKPQDIKPFMIDKTGYGVANAWISIDNITTIKK